jgi:hypothetical protein
MSESTLRGSPEREPTTIESVDVTARRDVAVHDEDDIPGMEPWLWMVMASFLPVVIAFLVPHAYKVALFVASGGLLAAGILMLVGQQRRKRRGDGHP